MKIVSEVLIIALFFSFASQIFIACHCDDLCSECSECSGCSITCFARAVNYTIYHQKHELIHKINILHSHILEDILIRPQISLKDIFHPPKF